MHFDISRIVSQFQRKWTEVLNPAEMAEIFRAEGLLWRNRVLDPICTTQLFILQILHGNTSCAHLPRLARLQFSASAYCQARMRLPLYLLQTLMERLALGIQQEEGDVRKWRGHRTLLVDGSNFSMSDTRELDRHFGHPSGQKKGCSFPSAHLLALFHAGTGMILKVQNSPLATNDMSGMITLHPELRADDILLADRGFCSFGHIAVLFQSAVHSVMRVHQSKNVNFGRKKSNSDKRKARFISKRVKRLGLRDQIVEWQKPDKRNAWISAAQYAALPRNITVRELSYRLPKKGFRTREVILVTTLLCPLSYPAEELASLYGTRWKVETNFAHLKTTMGMETLQCKTVDGVLKELCVFCIVYNLVRLTMLEAAKIQGVSYERISFVDALRWLATAHQGDRLPTLRVNPLRPNRFEPRLKKRRPKNFKLLMVPRQIARKTSMFHGLAA